MPRQRRVRSTILSGNLQVRKALTERRYISACGRRSARKPATAKGEALGEPLKNRTGSWLVRFIKAIIQPFCGVVCNILPNHIIILLPADNVVIIAPLPYRKSGPLRHMCLHLADDLRNSRLSRRFVKPQQQMNMIRHDDGLINRCVRVEFRDAPDGLCGIPAIARERQPVQRALATRKGHAASVRRQSRQRLRSERRYRLPEVIAFSIGADRNEVRAGRTVIKFRQAMKAILRLTHTLSQHRSTISSIMPCRRWHSSRNCSTMSACMPWLIHSTIWP